MSRYRRVLGAAVADKVCHAAAAQLGRLGGACRAVIADAVKQAAARRCKPATGVLKAIRNQRPYTIPLRLSDEDEAAIAGLRRRGNEDLIMTRLDFNIRAYQLRTLEGTQWLNDQVINLYCAMVADAFPDRALTLGSFLMTKLLSNDRNALTESLRWTLDKDIFAAPKVLIVVNDGVHWTLAVMNNAQRRLEYYDSMGGRGEKYLRVLAAFLDAEYDIKAGLIRQHRAREVAAAKGKPLEAIKKKDERRTLLKAATPLPKTKPSTWQRYQPGKAVPQQDNTYDCGVFCSQFSLCVALDVPPSAVAQADMGFIRRLMMLELLSGKFLHRF